MNWDSFEFINSSSDTALPDLVWNIPFCVNAFSIIHSCEDQERAVVGDERSLALTHPLRRDESMDKMNYIT